MGRLLKNTQLRGGSYSVQLPLGSNTLGPDAPQDGQIRFNQSTSRIEFFYNSNWRTVAKVGNVAIAVDDLVSPDGITTVFTMGQTESDATAIVVTIGGVYQLPGTSYTVNGSDQITFTSPPPAPSLPSSPNRINIIHNLNSTDAAY
jgi:hypothetical protein